MTKPQKIEGGMEERFDKWRNDGEHESLSDKNGIISHWEVKMILEFIQQERTRVIDEVKGLIEQERIDGHFPLNSGDFDYIFSKLTNK